MGSEILASRNGGSSEPIYSWLSIYYRRVGACSLSIACKEEWKMGGGGFYSPQANFFFLVLSVYLQTKLILQIGGWKVGG